MRVVGGEDEGLEWMVDTGSESTNSLMLAE